MSKQLMQEYFLKYFVTSQQRDNLFTEKILKISSN